ncbi:hypothetical protein Esti_004870 [Eimeria stiedai]
MRGSSACCCGEPAARVSGVSAAQCRRRASLSLRGLSFFCLIILAATATTASSLPISVDTKGRLGHHTRPPPYACIRTTLASLRSAWRRLWGRSVPAAAEAAAGVAPAAAHVCLPSSSMALKADEEKEPAREAAAADAAAVALRHVKPTTAADFHGRAHGAAASAAAASLAVSEPAVSAAAAEEVRQAALWFEHQRDLWRQKTAAEIKRRLQAELAAREAERKQQELEERRRRPRRLVFTPASLKQRGWLAVRRRDPSRPLPCLLYAAVPPGRLAVAPATSSSSNNNDSSSSSNNSSSNRKEEDIPWVSFVGMARLNRVNPLKVKSLWFGQQAPDFNAFYEFAPPQVLLVRFLLDHKPVVPCLLAAACCGAAFAAREPLSRFLVSFFLSSSVWRRYALWSPVLHAPPALALLLLRLLLQGARTAGEAATAACRKGLEELEAALLEAFIQDNFQFSELQGGVETASHVAESTPPA